MAGTEKNVEAIWARVAAVLCSSFRDEQMPQQIPTGRTTFHFGMGECEKGFCWGVQISIKENSVECCGLEFNQLLKIILQWSIYTHLFKDSAWLISHWAVQRFGACYSIQFLYGCFSLSKFSVIMTFTYWTAIHDFITTASSVNSTSSITMLSEIHRMLNYR